MWLQHQQFDGNLCNSTYIAQGSIYVMLCVSWVKLSKKSQSTFVGKQQNDSTSRKDKKMSQPKTICRKLKMAQWITLGTKNTYELIMLHAY